MLIIQHNEAIHVFLPLLLHDGFTSPSNLSPSNERVFLLISFLVSARVWASPSPHTAASDSRSRRTGWDGGE